MNDGAVSVGYLEPVRRAWGRMVAILFRPFDLGKWFVLGFAAWLATLFSGTGTANLNFNFGEHLDSVGELFIGESVQEFSHIFSTLMLIVVGVFLLLFLAIWLVVTWVRARGHFIFLDSVMCDRLEIRDGWRRYRSQGNSLFIWNLCFGGIVGLLALIIILIAALVAASSIGSGGGTPATVAIFAGAGLLLVAIFVVSSYTACFLNDFVTPLMWSREMTVIPAWRQFFDSYRKRPLSFLLYGPFKLCVMTLVALILFGLSLLTCCLLSCLLGIPYIRAVVVLPVLVFYRSLGPEFFAQFDDSMVADKKIWIES